MELPGKLLVVAGPTATGKSELAVAVAEAIDAEVIGADSRQVYRFLDIGTAKPSPEQRARVPHHMVDVVDPDASYDVARWRRDALESLSDVAARGRRAVVCGGTGLYLRSLMRGLFRGPAADPALREGLLAEEREEPGSLLERLSACDPEAAGRLHANDLVRIVRAIEVHALSGRSMSDWQREHALAERPFDVLVLVLGRSPAELEQRISARSEAMVCQGLIEEVRALGDEGWDMGARAFDTIGYREASECLAGRLRADALAAAITVATRRYAKRQRTWLRGQVLAVLPERERCELDADDHAAAIGLARRFFS